MSNRLFYIDCIKNYTTNMEIAAHYNKTVAQVEQDKEVGLIEYEKQKEKNMKYKEYIAYNLQDEIICHVIDKNISLAKSRVVQFGGHKRGGFYLKLLGEM